MGLSKNNQGKGFFREQPPLPQKMTLGELLQGRCFKYGEKTFLIDPVNKKEYSYIDFQNKVNSVSNFLWRMGIRKDDKVSILMSNSPEFLLSLFSIVQLGAIACPVNIHLKKEEAAFILNDSDSVALFVGPEYWDMALHLQAEAGRKISLFLWNDETAKVKSIQSQGINVNEAVLCEKETLLAEVETINLDPENVAEIIYTSGTTGKPKGAMLTHHNLVIDAHWIAACHQLQEQDRAMCVMPLFHVNGQVVTVITPLFHGGSIVLPERFSVTRFFPDIVKHGVTYTGTVATMLSMLLSRFKPVDISKESRLRVVFCGSAPVPVHVQVAFEQTFRVPVIEGYGMTETTCRSTFNLLPPPDKLKLGESDSYRKLGSVGLPLGNEMMVLDDRGRQLGPGEIGEIVIRGENLMKGYYNNPQATAEAFRDGWFHSGDLGFYDEDGYFTIVDRKNDMIIRGGENIYPREIEEVLYSHRAIKDAACMGVPHELYGEEVVGFVVLKDNEAVAEEEIISFCGKHLAAFKCPKQIKIVEQIPKSASGKLLRRKLMDRI